MKGRLFLNGARVSSSWGSGIKYCPPTLNIDPFSPTWIPS